MRIENTLISLGLTIGGSLLVGIFLRYFTKILIFALGGLATLLLFH